ncbi:ribose 5-phosphate isomerase B [Desulfopila sp. IMCC35008]|uniref:ribose 5-phosphate isomerase B n=1 Tax=Desulfopila sp. IMCC35008 TaxID=2653858 RepID=UPI0013D426EB|nr:ribose 5-phosphate isomerase B [Desulfopila sp. IMCC35008]
MNVVVGADHGGFELKEHLIVVLSELGHEVTDVGCYSLDSVDYPDIAGKVREKILAGNGDRGILICGTGIGMSIAVNRSLEIRAALCHDEYTARMSREHNNANVLCLGARVTGLGVAEEIVRVWMETEFEGGRHQRRIAKYSR